MQKDYPKVSIIILNWNGLEDTVECLESLKKVTYPNYEVIVVDNASEGNDVQVLREKFGDYIQLIQNDRNYGCAEGYNTGIRFILKKSKSKYIMTMNNDVIVAPDFLDELVRVAEGDEQIGIVGPKIYYYDYKGRNNVILDAGGEIRKWSLKIHHRIGENDDDLLKYQKVKSVDWVTGAVLMFKSYLVEKVGLWNNWYFIGYEDIEFCLKVKKHGFKVVYVPTSRAWHKVAVSLKRAGMTHPNLSNYYYMIRQCFPLYVYIYHLLLLPVVLLRWAFLYTIRDRDIYSLRRFLSSFAEFVIRRGKTKPKAH